MIPYPSRQKRLERGFEEMMTKKYTLIFHWWKDGREEEIYNVTEKGDPKGKGIKADCQTYNENMTDDRRADGYYKVRES